MKTISAFTFVHNAIDSGYPVFEAIKAIYDWVDEIVIVDMQSTDRTRDLLYKIELDMSDDDLLEDVNFVVVDGFWGNDAGETLRQAHSKYTECSGDIILHFEADEVYSPSLLNAIISMIHRDGIEDIAVYRLQLEQNFQRCRWYPEPVHRVFSRLSHTRKVGHTTDRHHLATVLDPNNNGFLWDVTNCFRDNYLNRINKQAELRQEEPNYLAVPIHCTLPSQNDFNSLKMRLQDPHWTWTNTPFDIPEVLRPLVGKTKYEVDV